MFMAGSMAFIRSSFWVGFTVSGACIMRDINIQEFACLVCW